MLNSASENFGQNNRGESVKRFRGLPINTIYISNGFRLVYGSLNVLQSFLKCSERPVIVSKVLCSLDFFVSFFIKKKR